MITFSFPCRRNMFNNLTLMFDKACAQHSCTGMRTLTRDHLVSAIFYYEGMRYADHDHKVVN